MQITKSTSCPNSYPGKLLARTAPAPFKSDPSLDWMDLGWLPTSKRLKFPLPLPLFLPPSLSLVVIPSVRRPFDHHPSSQTPLPCFQSLSLSLPSGRSSPLLNCSFTLKSDFELHSLRQARYLVHCKAATSRHNLSCPSQIRKSLCNMIKRAFKCAASPRVNIAQDAGRLAWSGRN